MENIDKILEKLMLNRTRLMLNRFDEQLKEIIESDLQAFKSTGKQQLGNRQKPGNGKMMVA
ncbi:hypothetical protein [Mucilaginibacter paludis]|uniref:Transposase n=1 Tax=Mucilaginibacter paludis DSM 18603 TaxID=714943 RepID=H1Y1Q9_9SPHI|nr:hypothetical protein [Mucilaginibacter paludis]EHQ24718.1 hypothetical protein Mucpa_0526 [Mucilaginibacter paludis DSM 18603]